MRYYQVLEILDQHPYQGCGGVHSFNSLSNFENYSTMYSNCRLPIRNMGLRVVTRRKRRK